MNRSLTLKKRGESAVQLEEPVSSDSIVTVGSDPGATIALADPAIAPEQFVVIDEGSETVLMNRAAGTRLNGDELNPGARVALAVGDRIEAGDFVLLYGDAPFEKGDTPPMIDEPEIAKAAAVSAKRQPVSKAPEVAPKETGSPSDIKESLPDKANSKEKKDFSKILYELKEEDTFFFHLRDSDDVIRRIPFTNDLLWIGTKLGNVSVVAEEGELDEVFARVNKDWSGVVVYPRNDQKTRINGEDLNGPARLRNKDVLSLVDDFEDEEMPTSITFHEPVSLLALSSILPGDLPEPVTTEEPGRDADKAIESRDAGARTAASAGMTSGPRLVLGYYTIMEIVVMAFGTLVTAAIIFFVLELV